ncbi:unnamed protein product [Candida parapsilosis]
MPQEISLSLEETNKIRAKLGLQPIKEQPKSHNNVIEITLEETNKIRLSLGLNPISAKAAPNTASKAVESIPDKVTNDELLSQKLAKAKVASEKRKLLGTTQGDDDDNDDEIDTDDWLLNVGNTQSAKKQKIETAPAKKHSNSVNAHIGHSAKELQTLRNNDILTLQDTDILEDDDADDVLINEALSANAKVRKNLDERKEAEMIKFNGRHYKRNRDDEDPGQDELENGMMKKPVVINNSSIDLRQSESTSNKAESAPPNTTKFNNLFDNWEDEPTDKIISTPQIKMKKLKKRKPLESAANTVSTTRVKPDDFEQLPNLDEDDYDNLHDNYISTSQRMKQRSAKPKMTPEDIALEIARNKKMAMERKLEEESMRRQFSAETFENVEDLDTVGFLSNLEKNILDRGSEVSDDDIFDSTKREVNGRLNSHDTATIVDNRNGSLESEKKEESLGDTTNDDAVVKPQVPRDTNEDNHPKFNTGLADTLKFLRSRSNESNSLQQTDRSSTSTREEISKETELLKLKIDIEERILRQELTQNMEYMKLSKVDREKFFETELDKRLVGKGIVAEAAANKRRFNQGNGSIKSMQKTNLNKAKGSFTTTTATTTQGADGNDKYVTYNPKVELNYKDDEGKLLDTKQAYKHLSHKYHGMTTSQRLAKSRKKREKGKFGGSTIKEEIVD